MNEGIFFLQILVIVASIWGALKMGKEALISLSVLLAILANFFVLKQMKLFGWNVTCSDAFAIGSLFGLNLLQRGFGKEVARKTVWISFFGMIFFVILSQIHLLYVPSRFDTSHIHFKNLLDSTPRLLTASVVTFFIVQQIDVRLFAIIKNNTVCLLISQAIDTVLFTFLGLYGIIQEIFSMMIVSYLVKCIVIVMTFFSSRLLKPHAI